MLLPSVHPGPDCRGRRLHSIQSSTSVQAAVVVRGSRGHEEAQVQGFLEWQQSSGVRNSEWGSVLIIS